MAWKNSEIKLSDILASVLPEYKPISEAPDGFKNDKQLYKAINAQGVWLCRNPATWRGGTKNGMRWKVSIKPKLVMSLNEAKENFATRKVDSAQQFESNKRKLLNM